MLYSIIDNENGIMIQGKNKNKLLKMFFNNELEITNKRGHKKVNKVIKEYHSKQKTILLIEIN